jgi:hypothetical protein
LFLARSSRVGEASASRDQGDLPPPKRSRLRGAQLLFDPLSFLDELFSPLIQPGHFPFKLFLDGLFRLDDLIVEHVQGLLTIDRPGSHVEEIEGMLWEKSLEVISETLYIY